MMTFPIYGKIKVMFQTTNQQLEGIHTIKSHGKPPLSYGFPMVFLWLWQRCSCIRKHHDTTPSAAGCPDEVPQRPLRWRVVPHHGQGQSRGRAVQRGAGESEVLLFRDIQKQLDNWIFRFFGIIEQLGNWIFLCFSKLKISNHRNHNVMWNIFSHKKGLQCIAMEKQPLTIAGISRWEELGYAGCRLKSIAGLEETLLPFNISIGGVPFNDIHEPAKEFVKILCFQWNEALILGQVSQHVLYHLVI